MHKIRDAKAMLRAAGYTLRQGKGSHQIWLHSLSGARLTLCGNDGEDLDKYQEARLRKQLIFIRRAS